MIADGVFRTPGEFAGYLGKEHDPLFITKNPNDPGFSVDELTFPLEVPLARVSNRLALRWACRPIRRGSPSRSPRWPRPGHISARCSRS